MAVHYSRGSVAYDYDQMMSHFSRTPPEEKTEEPQAPKAQLQAIPGGRSAANTSALFRAKTLMMIFFVLLVAGVMLHSYMLVAQLTSDVASSRNELNELRAIQTALLTKQEYTLSDESIEEFAKANGMYKLDNSQVEWYEMSNPDRVEVSGSGAGFGGVLDSLMQSFSAVLEYLH